MRAWLEALRLRVGILTEEERQYAYLSEAVDRIDLEARIRHIDRGTWSR